MAREQNKDDHDTPTRSSLGIVLPYSTKTSSLFLKNLITVMDRVFQKIYVVSTDLEDPFFSKYTTIQIPIPEKRNILSRIYYFMKIQFVVAYHIIRLRKKVNRWIFYLGGETLLVPLIVSRLINVRISLMLGGALEKETSHSEDILVKILQFYYRFSLNVCDRIIIYSPSILDQWNLNAYKDKIIVFPRHYVDFNIFCINKPYSKREKNIGYIGKFSKLKGVPQLINAIRILAGQDTDLKFIFIGSGELQDDISNLYQDPRLKDRILIHHWVNHDKIPDYLNTIKLLVLPSCTEGLPNIMLESMACGTPVLASRVGSIPDIIIDGENGYLLPDVSPESIAEKILMAINTDNPDSVSDHAADFSRKNFSLAAAVEKCRQSIARL